MVNRKLHKTALVLALFDSTSDRKVYEVMKAAVGLGVIVVYTVFK